MALIQQDDAELLIRFRNPATKEPAYTTIIKKYQERLYWHVRRMVVDHEDATTYFKMCLSAFGRRWKILKKNRNYIHGFTALPLMNR